MSYWVVGAMWGGSEDQLPVFLRRGYWFLGWDNDAQPDQAALRDQIAEGDRIAVKRMLGRGSSEIEIRAIGIVTDLDENDGRVYVDWKLTDLERRVPARGCFKSIHGPFEADDEWVHQAFCL